MDISGKTKLVGILGYPVSHSLSPRMHNAAYRAMGLDICYIPLPVKPPDLQTAVQGLQAVKFLGANVTIPHKVAAAGLMDRLDESTAKIRAVNTIVNTESGLAGHNTDGEGFVRALEEVTTIDYGSAPAVLIGAGGAARAIAFALAEKGIKELAIINRSRDRAVALKTLLGNHHSSLPVSVLAPDDVGRELVTASKLVINATPLGMKGNLKSVPVAVDNLTEDHVVCDIVYSGSGDTPMISAAREKGAVTLGGLGMLLHQGAASIRLWTGMDPPLDEMRRAIEFK